MDNDNFLNNQPTQTKNPLEQDKPVQDVTVEAQVEAQSEPVVQMRVEAQPETRSATQVEMNTGTELPQGREKNNRWGIIVIAIVAGIVIGALVVFGIMKAMEKPAENCPECNCPADASAATGDTNFDFLKMEAASKNIIYSPLSIRNGLGLLSAGANGATKTEIDKVLGDAPIAKYDAIPDKLSLANAVFIRDTYREKVLSSYTSTVQSDYDGEVMYDDFKSSANMDNWVKNKTFNLIDSIGIQPREDLNMVLANALAIQMDWKHQFNEDNTSGQTFYKSDGSKIEATTMNRESHDGDITYYTDDDLTAISLPLTTKSREDLMNYYYDEDSTATGVSGNDSSDEVHLDFVAIMPADIDTYIKNMKTNGVDELVGKMTAASEPRDGLIYSIPKFKYDYELNFESDLKGLGMNLAFNRDAADFSKMSSEPLYVGEAVHKANIDFSEKGIKAAAVTVFAMDIAAVAEDRQLEPVVLHFDHPFVYVIRDADNGTIWFTGTMYEPNLWADDEADYKTQYDW